ncbi:MAG: AI-2E family transporter, partial [Clostridia bacterium]|nr:AI-2E family transporter [Clostridia bacterium]
SFSDKIPQYAKTVEVWYGNLSEFLEQYNFELPELPKLVVGSSSAKDETLISSLIDKYGNKLLGTTVNVTTSIVSIVVDLVLGVVFAIYLLAQKEKLGNQIKRACLALFGKTRADRLVELAALTDNVFAKFVTGQLTEAIIIGILCFIGMTIFRMPYAGIISVLVGFTALVPMVGSFIGTGIGAVLILFEDPIKAVWFVLFIIILQQFEGNLIYPKVVGKSVGLPGIWVLVSVTVGGALFGIPGMLFSVPLCTVVYVVFKEYVNDKIKNPQSEDDDETEMVEEIKE